MTDQPHLSVTQLKTYMRCPLQYFFRYTCGMRTPPTGGLALGRAVHQAIADNYRQKIETAKDLPFEQVADAFSDHWQREAGYTEFEPGEKPGELKDQGVALLRTYQEQVAPNVQPAEVEREFLVQTDASELPLNGYIDLIDDQGCIVDHKTAKRSFPQDAAERDIQLTAYATAYRALQGEPEKGVRLDVMVKNKKPKVQQLEGTRTQADIDRFLRIVEQVDRGIQTGVHYPNEGYSCGICGYRDVCGEW